MTPQPTPPPSFHPAAHAAERPDAVAVVDSDGRTLTYGDLATRSAQLANSWWERGLRTGDHVAIYMESRLEFFEIYWAALRSGLYLTAVNNHLTAPEAGHIVANCDARLLFVSASTRERAAAFVDDAALLEDVLLVGDGPADGLTPYAASHTGFPGVIERDEPLGRTMLYTSGSTGRPKGVKRPLTGRTVAEGGDLARQLRERIGLGPDAVYLSTAPFYHAASVVYLDAMLSNGAKAVAMARFDAEDFLRLIEQHRVTLVQLVPTMIIRLLKLDPEVRARYDVSSLQAVIHGAGPCPPEVKRQLIDWLGPIVFEYYGGTEDNGFTFISTEEWLAHPGSVGAAGEGVTLRICDDDGAEVPQGELGLVYFDNPAVETQFTYHKAEGGAASALHPQHPGWTTLGDIGYLDADGYLYLTDRRNHMIVRGGVNVYPREVEDGLITHPAVADVAVFGVPHDDLGEEVVAVVQPAAGVEPTADLAALLREHARAAMAHYKAPTSIDFTPELPRAATGKLIKGDVRAAFLARRGASA